MDVRLDPVRYEIFFNKLDQALNESQQVVRYLSGSAIVREAGEAMESFYLPTGEGVDIAAGILMHFMNITRCIHYMADNNYGGEDIGVFEGDQFINNDAYIGGMHCPDTCLIAPFFQIRQFCTLLSLLLYPLLFSSPSPHLAHTSPLLWHAFRHALCLQI